MKYHENSAEDVIIAYIGGGSRGWAWGLMSDLASQGTLCGTVRLYDIDKEAAYANEIIGNKVKDAEGAKSAWNYKAVDSIGEALSGADFVVLSILPGTFDEMYSDVHAPEKYGIYQSVGDTAGPGGILRALRTIPMYVEIAKAIREYCPNAWVINYTNPMTLCVRTLYEVFPEIKAFGCCHEVFSTQELLSKALYEMRGISGVKRSDISVNVQGINHFTWLNKAWYRDIDLLEVYREFADKYYEEGYIPDESKHWMNSSFFSASRVKFDLFKRYGSIAAAGDRHLAEFMPGKMYLKDPETVKKWGFALTSVDWRKEDLKKRLKRSADLVSGAEVFEIKNTGEEGINQMIALAGFKTLVTNVNLPNIGQAPDLPLGEVVETNAVFRHNTVTPVAAGRMSNEVCSLVSRHVFNHQTVLKAALTGDKHLAFKAFINDPLMTADLEDAKKLFNEMIENTKKYLKFM
ncbi:MAG: alpha-glucosidase/alpha-galactosidase [Clostridia bacterium]|nr:alpha-glucosidase/alpha-galactosidase [Clostridia bacterium]